ncbi:MAG: pyridoxal phosphate-dependent aminotransferase [Acidobacteria bacterium]|nr:MAG: pyridoxal phosphate-dependent aminotransferase [Acidobacteriota bacterium]
MNLATRISRISVSKTMAVMEAAIKLREQGIDVVDFGPGEPDFPTPENIKQAGIRAIQADFTKYTAIGGIKELKKAIVDKHAREFGSKYEPSECVVNIGGKHAIFSIFAAVVNEGDDVVIPTPYWVTFADIARFVDSNPIFLATKESDGFRLTAEILEPALTPKTRLVVLNSPNNPSGAVVDDAEFGRIARLCRERNVYLLSDECYSHFLYDGRKPFSVASYMDMKSHIIIAGSVSKTYSMTGWRIGYVLAMPEIINAIVKLQSHSTSNPTSISQKAALEALTGPQESVGIMLAEYARRRKFVLDRLRAIPGVKCAEPGGAFYAYPNISAAFGRGGIRDSVDFSAKLLEKAHVAVTPGEAFGTREHVRISYATSMEQLDKGLKRIHEFTGSL